MEFKRMVYARRVKKPYGFLFSLKRKFVLHGFELTQNVYNLLHIFIKKFFQNYSLHILIFFCMHDMIKTDRLANPNVSLQFR